TLKAGKPLGKPRIIRHAVEGERRFFAHGLTPDGRSYYWTGPREPAQRYRAEVYKVDTGELLLQVHLSADKPLNYINAQLSADGGSFWVDDQSSYRLHRLDGGASPRTAWPVAVSADSAWVAIEAPHRQLRAATTLALLPGSEAAAWLEFDL